MSSGDETPALLGFGGGFSAFSSLNDLEISTPKQQPSSKKKSKRRKTEASVKNEPQSSAAPKKVEDDVDEFANKVASIKSQLASMDSSQAESSGDWKSFMKERGHQLNNVQATKKASFASLPDDYEYSPCTYLTCTLMSTTFPGFQCALCKGFFHPQCVQQRRDSLPKSAGEKFLATLGRSKINLCDFCYVLVAKKAITMNKLNEADQLQIQIPPPISKAVAQYLEFEEKPRINPAFANFSKNQDGGHMTMTQSGTSFKIEKASFSGKPTMDHYIPSAEDHSD